MNFLSTGIPIGHWFGITVRLHFTFLIYAYYRATGFDHLGFGLVYVFGLYFCILLHEFGHALAAKWCDGEANEILLWPLGGLAFVRPAFHPTAHLITTVAGPFVTLVLWLLFWTLTWALSTYTSLTGILGYVYWFALHMKSLNLWLLLFNLIPCFPMDGGRILRDTIWHFMSAEKATKIAVIVSRCIAIIGAAWAIYSGNYMLVLLALFIWWQTSHEISMIVGMEARGAYSFSIRERIQRARRSRAFFKSIEERKRGASYTGFHRCHVCGRTENDATHLEFRVCSDCAGGEEYCAEHLHNHKHV